MASEKLSNVIGAPFAEHVLTQLNLRAAHNSTGQGAVSGRSNDEVLFLANKMSWVKLTSSVKIVPGVSVTADAQYNTEIAIKPITSFYKKLGVNYANPDDLAKNWTLEAGTSKANGANIDLRYGIGPDGAYGLGGTEELGYRPMPGLTSVNIDTKGTLGSLREATIQFKVWNMNQLNIIEALYFRLGYSMILEWGHNQFYTNVNKQGGGGTFTTNTYGIDPFQPNLRKEKVQQLIARRSYELSGNYDGMLGIVTNFHWSFNQTGGYDCTLRLVGLGAIMDSLRINSSYVMPSALFQAYKSMNETLALEKARQDKIDADNAEAQKRKVAGLEPLPATPTNPQEIYTNIYTADKGTANPSPNLSTFLANQAIPTAYIADTANKAVNTIFDYYYKANQGGKSADPGFVDELNSKRTGLFLSPIPDLRPTWQLVPTGNYPAVTLSAGLLNLAAVRAANPDVITVADPNGFTLDDSTAFINKNKFTRLLDLALITYRSRNIRTSLYDLLNGNFQGIKPEDPIYAALSVLDVAQPVERTLNYTATVSNPVSIKQQKQNSFSITLSYTPLPFDSENKAAIELDKTTRPTRQELITAFDNWVSTNRKVQINSITGATNTVTIKGTINLVIPNKPAVEITIEFNNTALIQSVLASPVAEGTPQNATQNANAGDNGGVGNESDPSQTDPGYRFASALHAMLAAAKSQVEYEMTKNQDGVVKVPLKDSTKEFYKGSIFEGLLDAKESPTVSEFDLIQYALKGFNSNLMVNPDLFPKIQKVDFDSLTTAYGVRWTIQADTNKINHPAYLKLGYILSFLNAMCLVYDSTVDTNKHPYVYLDYNPYTNFCLTTPQHMSVDPFTCMIPYQGNQEDYLKLFPPDVAPSPDPKSDIIFSENLNALSYYLPAFKVGNNPYQGSTMEILLNIDFLISTLDARTTSSPDHTVDLKGFLDDIMTGINKATGNLNSFRVSYRDDSNTVIIKDDQFVPPIDGEASAITNKAEPTNYDVPNGVNVPKYGQLPIFGKYSLVRELRLETDMSTKISNVIAISAQAYTGSVNSTDHSAFSWLNANFQDRYKPRISDSSDTNSQSNYNNPTEEERRKQEEAANKAAHEFNQHVVSIYKGGVALSKQMVSAAINYYINGIAQVKSKDRITLAAPFIPANLNITIDGIAGIVMGNAFTIPEDRLPLSLRGQGGVDKNTKVGFVVVGLTHSLDNNQWLTKIRGQMIKLRDSTAYGITSTLKELQLTFPVAATTDNLLTFTGDAFESAVNFVKQRESLASIQKLDTSAKNTRIPYAPKNPAPGLILYPYNLEGNQRSDGTYKLTIGWGTYDTYRAGPKAGKIIAPNDTITVQLAEENLRVELASLYKEVLEAAKKYNVTPTAGQVVALLDLGYNAGSGGMKDSPLWRAFINKQAPNKDDLIKFGIAKGFSSNLTSRRGLEYNAFIS